MAIYVRRRVAYRIAKLTVGDDEISGVLGIESFWPKIESTYVVRRNARHYDWLALRSAGVLGSTTRSRQEKVFLKVWIGFDLD